MHCAYQQRVDGTWICTVCGDFTTHPSDKAPLRICGKVQPPTPQQLHPELCQYRGAELRQQKCTTCSGPTRIKVFACSIHAECTIGKQLPGLACCAAGCCQDWDPLD